MKLIKTNLVIITVTIILKLCQLSVCASAYDSKYGSHENQHYAYSSSLANESPEHSSTKSDKNIDNIKLFCDKSRTKIIGGGELIKIKENRKCKNNYIGLKQHPRNKRYYYICQRNSIALGRCTNGKVFNDTYKYCAAQKHCLPNTIVYDEPKHKFNVSQCYTSGIFSIEGTTRCYYTCVYLAGRFIQKIYKCPRGTIFNSTTGTCIARAKFLTPKPIITPNKNLDGQCKPIPIVAQPNKYKSSEKKVICTPGTYSADDESGYYYKCTLKSDGKYYQVKLKCPSGESFDSSSEECVSNDDFDYLTEFSQHSIARLIRNKKRNLLNNLPRLFTSQNRRTDKRIKLFDIINQSDETEEETVKPITNGNFCGCRDVNKYANNKEGSDNFELQNDEILENQPKHVKPISDYESGYADLETQDKSYESSIEYISKDNLNQPHINVRPVHQHHCKFHRNVHNSTTTPNSINITATMPTENATSSLTPELKPSTTTEKTFSSRETSASPTENTRTILLPSLLKLSTTSVTVPTTTDAANLATTDLERASISQQVTLAEQITSSDDKTLISTPLNASNTSMTTPITQNTTIIDEIDLIAAETARIDTILKNALISIPTHPTSEQPGSVKLSTPSIETSKPETITQEDGLKSSIPRIISGNGTTTLMPTTEESTIPISRITYSDQSNFNSFALSSVETSTPTVLAEEFNSTTLPTSSENLTTKTTIPITEVFKNKAMIEERTSISMSTSISSEPLHTSSLPANFITTPTTGETTATAYISEETATTAPITEFEMTNPTTLVPPVLLVTKETTNPSSPTVTLASTEQPDITILPSISNSNFHSINLVTTSISSLTKSTSEQPDSTTPSTQLIKSSKLNNQPTTLIPTKPQESTIPNPTNTYPEEPHNTNRFTTSTIEPNILIILAEELISSTTPPHLPDTTTTTAPTTQTTTNNITIEESVSTSISINTSSEASDSFILPITNPSSTTTPTTAPITEFEMTNPTTLVPPVLLLTKQTTNPSSTTVTVGRIPNPLISEIPDSTTTETGSSTTASTEQPDITILPSISNSNFHSINLVTTSISSLTKSTSEQPDSTTPSTQLIKSSKLNNQPTTLIPTKPQESTIPNPTNTYPEEPHNTNRFTTSTIEPNILIILAEELISSTTPPHLPDTTTTTAPTTQTTTNNITIEESVSTSISINTSSEASDSFILPITNPSSTTTPTTAPITEFEMTNPTTLVPPVLLLTKQTTNPSSTTVTVGRIPNPLISEIPDSTTTETGSSTTASTEQPDITILPSISNSNFHSINLVTTSISSLTKSTSEQPDSTTPSTQLINSSKLNNQPTTLTTTKPQESTIPNPTNTYPEEPHNTNRFTTSTIEPNILIILAEELISSTTPPPLQDTTTTTAPTTQTTTNNITIEESVSTSISINTSSEASDSFILPITNPSSSTTTLVTTTTTKSSIPREIDSAVIIIQNEMTYPTTLIPPITQMTANEKTTNPFTSTNTNSITTRSESHATKYNPSISTISVSDEQANSKHSTITNKTDVTSTEALTIPEITTSEDIGRVIDINESESESGNAIYKNSSTDLEDDSKTGIDAKRSVNSTDWEIITESTKSSFWDDNGLDINDNIGSNSADSNKPRSEDVTRSSRPVNPVTKIDDDNFENSDQLADKSEHDKMLPDIPELVIRGRSESQDVSHDIIEVESADDADDQPEISKPNSSTKSDSKSWPWNEIKLLSFENSDSIANNSNLVGNGTPNTSTRSDREVQQQLKTTSSNSKRLKRNEDNNLTRSENKNQETSNESFKKTYSSNEYLEIHEELENNGRINKSSENPNNYSEDKTDTKNSIKDKSDNHTSNSGNSESIDQNPQALEHSTKNKNYDQLAVKLHRSGSEKAKNLSEITESAIIRYAESQGALDASENRSDQIKLVVQNSSKVRNETKPIGSKVIDSSANNSLLNKSNEDNLTSSVDQSHDRVDISSNNTDKNQKLNENSKTSPPSNEHLRIHGELDDNQGINRPNNRSEDKSGSKTSGHNKPLNKTNASDQSAFNQTGEQNVCSSKSTDKTKIECPQIIKTGGPEISDDSQDTVKIDNSSSSVKHDDDGTNEFDHYDNDHEMMCIPALPSNCVCGIESTDGDPSKSASNSKRSNDFCCGCITNGTSDSGPADIILCIRNQCKMHIKYHPKERKDCKCVYHHRDEDGDCVREKILKFT